MSDHGQPPAEDTASRGPLVRPALSAIALVAVVSLAFWGIGTVRDEAETPVVAQGEDPEEEGEAPEEPDGPEPADEPEPEPEPEEPEQEPDEPEDEDADEPEPEDPAPTEEDGADAAEPTERQRAVAPGDVTIQVLDGAKTDGGAAADGVADLLSGEGYAIIARNDALTYEVTTVLYNPGHQAAAEQVAAELGGAEVRPQPGNLSSAPSLHVVVGLDRV